MLRLLNLLVFDDIATAGYDMERCTGRLEAGI